jgi:hypothetical protein
MRRFRSLLAIAPAAFLLVVACDTEGDDDDTTNRTIDPPDGCDLLALSNVVFDWEVTIEGEVYTEDTIEELMIEFQVSVFPFNFTGSVTELGPVPDTSVTRLVITQDPPEEPDPEFDPSVLRIDYRLPDEYGIPVEVGQGVFSQMVMDITRGVLVHGFAIVQSDDDGGELLFLAEPSNEGMVYSPGPNHPMFNSVATRDRACPNTRNDTGACANPYNLSLQFLVKAEEVDGPKGPNFELYPTETADFTFGGGEFQVVNLWSYGYREISQEGNCQNSYDWSLDRFSYMLIRTGDAPASGDDDDSAK